MSNTESDSLVDLLKAWIDTDTWNESAEFLKANVEQLLSDEAIVALDLMIKEHEASGGESAGDLQYLEVLQQHRTILEASQAHSIAEVYEELLKRIELERLEAAVEALLRLRVLQNCLSRSSIIQYCSQSKDLLLLIGCWRG